MCAHLHLMRRTIGKSCWGSDIWCCCSQLRTPRAKRVQKDFSEKNSFSRIVVICGDFDERSRHELCAVRWSDESWCIFRIKVSLSLSAEINWCVCVVRVVDVRFMYFYCVIDDIVCVCLWTHLQQWMTFCGVPLLSFRECLLFSFFIDSCFLSLYWLHF